MPCRVSWLVDRLCVHPSVHHLLPTRLLPGRAPLRRVCFINRLSGHPSMFQRSPPTACCLAFSHLHSFIMLLIVISPSFVCPISVCCLANSTHLTNTQDTNFKLHLKSVYYLVYFMDIITVS